jgi:hypothetical protein
MNRIFRIIRSILLSCRDRAFFSASPAAPKLGDTFLSIRLVCGEIGGVPRRDGRTHPAVQRASSAPGAAGEAPVMVVRGSISARCRHSRECRRRVFVSSWFNSPSVMSSQPPRREGPGVPGVAVGAFQASAAVVASHANRS